VCVCVRLVALTCCTDELTLNNQFTYMIHTVEPIPYSNSSTYRLPGSLVGGPIFSEIQLVLLLNVFLLLSQEETAKKSLLLVDIYWLLN